MGQRESQPAVNLDKAVSFLDEQIEARIAHENLVFIQKRALELTIRRERLLWEVLAAGTMTALLLVAGSIYKRKDLVVPIAGLIMGAGYRYDTVYGSHYDNVRDSADEILKNDAKKISLVGGPLSLAEVDKFWQRP